MMQRYGMWFVMGLLLGGLLAGAGCRFDKQISGRVTDYETGEPLQDAVVSTAQTGWGISRGSLVWDKTHVTQTLTNAAGAFTIHYRVGDSARLAVELAGYQRYQSWYARNSRVQVRLKRLLPDYQPRPQGFLRVGQRVDGSYYGWNFSCACMAGAGKSDIIPESMEPSTRGRLRLRAPGGIRWP